MTKPDQYAGEAGRGRMFAKDRELVAQMLRVASTFDRDHRRTTAALLRKAAYRLEKLAQRSTQTPDPQP